MSETKQTRCPFCSSVFNITDDQLAARGGHVRCGSCLQVFRADQHLVTGGAAVPPAPAPAPAVPASVPVVARTQSASPTPAPAPKKRKNPDDESWAFNLLGDDTGEAEEPEVKKPAARATPEPAAPPPPPPSAPAAKKPLFDDELSDLLHDSWAEPTKEKAHLKGIGEVDKIKASADESWAQALMSELEEEEKKEQAKNYSMEVQPKQVKEPPRKAAANAAPEARPARGAPAPEAAGTSASSAKEDDLLNFLSSNSAPTINHRHASLPLEVRAGQMTSVNWGYWITWTLLCLAGVVLLIAQYVYFNFERLALAESTRPQILQVCGLLNCKVPEPPDIKLLVVNKLVVRSHPVIKDALRVNAILYNKASFAQPLPMLKLSFANRKHVVTAERVFRPQEYLQGEAAHLRRIPPETPIHIELDLADPKVDLSGYKMQPQY